MQVGHIRKGINPPSAHQIFWTGKYVATGVKIGLVAAFIALTVRTFFVTCSVATNVVYFGEADYILSSSCPELFLCHDVSNDISYVCNSQEAIAIGRTFASLKDYHLDGNKEMIAYGVMNMCGAVTSCYVSTGAGHTFSSPLGNTSPY